MIIKPSKLNVPYGVLVLRSASTTLLLFSPSKVHLATMSEHLIVIDFLMHRENVLSVLHVPVKVDPYVAMTVSHAAAFATAAVRPDVATVIVAARTTGARQTAWKQKSVRSHAAVFVRKFRGRRTA